MGVGEGEAVAEAKALLEELELLALIVAAGVGVQGGIAPEAEELALLDDPLVPETPVELDELLAPEVDVGAAAGVLAAELDELLAPDAADELDELLAPEVLVTVAAGVAAAPGALAPEELVPPV